MILSRPARGYVFKCPRAIMPACVQRQQQRHFNGCRCGCDLVGRAVAVGSSLSPTGANCGPRFVIAVFGEEFFLPFSRAAEKNPCTKPATFPIYRPDRRAEQIFIEFAGVLEQLETFFPFPALLNFRAVGNFIFPPFSLSLLPSKGRRISSLDGSRLKIFPFLQRVWESR